ncbi:MAG: cupredoxin domain-containing protein [Dehalococcoidia bacterium]
MRRIVRLNVRAALVVGAFALVLTGAACSSSDESSDTKAASSAPAATVVNGAITVTAKDNEFEPKSFTAPAETAVTVTLDNKGAALHNFALVDQKGPDGKEIQTELIAGGKSDTVEFTLPAGTYDFHCTVHPAEMRGTLTVS